MINKWGENCPIVPFLTLGSSCKSALWCHPFVELRVSGLERNMARVSRSILCPKQYTDPTLAPPPRQLHLTRSHIWFGLHPSWEHQLANGGPRGLSRKVTRCHLKGLPALAEVQCCQFPTAYHLTGLKPSGEDSPECANTVNGDLISVNESMFLFGSNNR